MSKIRLHGTSSGYTDIAPTAAAGNNTLTAPTGTGTLVAEDSSGNITISEGLVHTGDTNTKIKFPAADTVSVETGGSERLRIDSSGRMGINQTSPQRILHIGTSGTAEANIRLEGGADYAELRVKDSDDCLSIHTNFAGGGSNERLRIDSNGYVGIKLTDPHLYYAKDLVVKSIDQGGITIRSTGTSDTQYLMFADGTSGNERYRGYVGYQHNTGGGGEHLQLAASGSLVVRVDSDGLKFGADTAAANALDDYEEGTFTPTATVEGESAANTDKNYGRYVKVGNKVTVWCYVQLNGTPSNRANNKAWQHGGLPFTHRNVTSGFDVAGTILHWTLDSNSGMTGTAPYTLVPRLFNNSTAGRIRAVGSDANQTGTNASLLMKDNTEYSYTFTYETA